ncbi:hypothetical protein G1H11_16175 [Phytoactinopolyspora alkaliphila]|uniref:DUF4913 domain-containing protein n=1 Tax=Phytoactinopolyspora alkaliphila TaxID=1783498 RepID=A0A6N9YPE6_9ACTN|nr:hypothetical protein [Phytoactinopolyspora alkaliphila]NED96844.1 hypothetical protein [Phytoactinopolyspora alkaliphila]
MTNDFGLDSDVGLAPEQVDAFVEELLGEAIPRPIVWSSLSSEQAQTILEDLAEWVCWLTSRYQLDGRELPPCWWRHGSFVEELSALRGAWLVSYDENQTAAAMADWHRIFHDTRHRLREWLSRAGCSTYEHRRGDQQPWAGDQLDAWWSEFRRDVEVKIRDVVDGTPGAAGHD